MSPELARYMQSKQAHIADKFRLLLGEDIYDTYPQVSSHLLKTQQAARYSVSSEGKRIRPIFVYAAAAAVGCEDSLSVALDYPALAIELIHTYSLIHDDLPAMDDDDLRRGKPSLHKAFDEATAILVGDGLQAQAFELLADSQGLSSKQKIDMVKVLAAASGPRGMVGGQAVDIAAVDTEISLQQLRAMHALKTGALIRAALAMGGIAANAGKEQLAALDSYGKHIGLAFQVVDDILDVEGDTATLGKTQGKDNEANKPTYVKLMGLAGAKTEAQELLDSALAALKDFDDAAQYLRDLAKYIVARHN